MTEYGQFCPVAKAAEIFAERWTPLVLRELLCGSTRYSEMRRGIPRISPSLLTTRLHELEAAGIIQRCPGPGRTHEYRLTEAGEALRPVVLMLGEWGQRWSRGRVKPAEYDPTVLMWDMRRRIRHDAIPTGGVVIAFHFPDAPNGKSDYWLVVRDDDVDVCLNDPGYEVNVYVSCPLRTMVEAWMGERDLSRSVRSGDIHVEGSRAHVRAFPGWLELSLFARSGRKLAKAATAPG